MGNSRQFRAGRRQKVLSQKERIRQLTAQLGYQEGLNMALAAQVQAAKMERPADLEEWIDSVVPDLSDEERAEWDAMSDDEREAFKNALGQKINAERVLLEAGEQASPSAGSLRS